MLIFLSISDNFDDDIDIIIREITVHNGCLFGWTTALVIYRVSFLRRDHEKKLVEAQKTSLLAILPVQSK